MKTDNFDDLVKLLALQRRQQPSEDFFCDFSDQVMARLETLPRPGPAPWTQRWAEALQGRCLLVAAFCVAVCGLFLAGLSLAQMAGEQAPAAALPEDLLKVVTLREPLLPDQWSPHPAHGVATPPAQRPTPANPEPVLPQPDDLRLRTVPASLYYNGK